MLKPFRAVAIRGEPRFPATRADLLAQHGTELSARERLQRCAHAPLQHRAGGPMVGATRGRTKVKARSASAKAPLPRG